MSYARTIAEGPARAYTYTRRNVIRSTETALRDFLEQEWAHQSELLGTEDAREGFKAFLERRPPKFRP